MPDLENRGALPPPPSDDDRKAAILQLRKKVQEAPRAPGSAPSLPEGHQGSRERLPSVKGAPQETRPSDIPQMDPEELAKKRAEYKKQQADQAAKILQEKIDAGELPSTLSEQQKQAALESIQKSFDQMTGDERVAYLRRKKLE